MSGIVGIIAGLAAVILGSVVDGDPISALFSVTAALIVLGGTFAALLTQFGFEAVVLGLKRLAWVANPPRVDLPAFIEQVAEWSNIARSQGALALENSLESVSNSFQRKGLQMIIDNTSQDDLLPTLGVLSEAAMREDQLAGALWETAGGYAPTIGVLGAVLGLIHVMMMLNHPDELGAGIATAFVATVYGVGSANLIFLPLGARFAGLAEARERERHVMMRGFALLAEGRPGILIRQSLQSYLADKPAKNSKEGGYREPAAEAA